jgi:HEAT repeat protein
MKFVIFLSVFIIAAVGCLVFLLFGTSEPKKDLDLHSLRHKPQHTLKPSKKPTGNLPRVDAPPMPVVPPKPAYTVPETVKQHPLFKEIQDLLKQYANLKNIRIEPGLNPLDNLERYRERQAKIEDLLNRLKALGEEAVPHIMETLKAEKDINNKIFLIRGLAGIGGEQAMANLATLLKEDRNYVIKRTIITNLAEQKRNDVYEILRDALTNEQDFRVKIIIMRELTEEKRGDITNLLTDLIRKDQDRNVRLEAIRSLGKLGDQSNSQILEELIRNDRDLLVRQNAIMTHARLNKEQSLPILEDLLRNEQNIRIRASAVLALSQVGGDYAVRVLEQVAQYDESEEIRVRAQRALLGLKRRKDFKLAPPEERERIEIEKGIPLKRIGR